MATKTIFQKYKDRYESKQAEVFPIEEYLDNCKSSESFYAGVHKRLLEAIGQPTIYDTSKDDRLGRIFLNKKIRLYSAYSEFYGIEPVLEQIVDFLGSASKFMEEARQCLYLMGPVGSSKSSLAETIKRLIQNVPFYTIQAIDPLDGEWKISPIYESPLGLFDEIEDGPFLEKEYKIDRRYTKYIMSPWAAKRLKEASGDISKAFRVVKVWPSLLHQIGVTKVEPSDENNQDISALVGKVSVHKLEHHSQNDPDAYNWAGGLNITTQGVLDFVEMFKSSIKTLNPLLTALQEGHYNGTEQFGAIPYQGLVLAHSNESEWTSFKTDKKNEAFLDRVNIIKVKYCTRTTEEKMIYDKILRNSDLKNASIAPGTLEMMAQYSVFTRLKEAENSNIFTKMEVYDGKNMKNKDPSSKSYEEYRDGAGINEGMSGSSTRFAYKVLSKTFQYDIEETAANPVHLMHVLENAITQEQLPEDEEKRRLTFINDVLKGKYMELIEKDIQQAFLENASEYMQNIFERYIEYAGHWITDKDFRDSDTNELYDHDALDKELEKIEKPAGIANPKDFRNDVVQFVLRAQVANKGQMIKWDSYEKIREVIEKRVFSSVEELLPVISFSKKASEDEQKKHNSFLTRMEEKGYTRKQTRILIEWWSRRRRHA